mgnify:CR=1 FL=1
MFIFTKIYKKGFSPFCSKNKSKGVEKLIKMTKMCGDEITVNAELIETIQATPDTVITLTTNKKILVEESVDQIVKKVIRYKKEISACLKVEEG